jgi:CDP-diacylglycerol--serine O-phosphatidyltransferase
MLRPKEVKERPRRESKKGFRSRLPAHLKERKLKVLSLSAVLPNITTMLALCAGMTAVRMALLERWDLAVVAILIAGFLDGMDGRLARLLGSASRFGAELDSFSDLISFGAAPALVIYLKGLHQWGETGWAIALFFTVCMALRLARFNTRSIEGGDAPTWSQGFFTGVPAPAGAYLALMPIMLQQYFAVPFLQTPLFSAIVLLTTSGLMVSRIPTYSLKKVTIPHRMVLPLMLLVVLTASAIYSQPWLTLSFIGVAYVGLLPFSIKSYRKLKAETQVLQEKEA